ncbi:metallophosphoesterase [Nannocystis pusilla]|uniref:metallophosphoesterase n=1 Tax=Nannocystis pusilla TaxID=889268 RepID=UPI003BF347E6
MAPAIDRSNPISPVIPKVQAQPAARLERRKQAIEAARGKIEEKLGRLTEEDLRELFALFNSDFLNGRVVQGRFATGLVGRNANLLVEQLGAVNQAVSKLWAADDAWIVENLVALRRGGSLPGGGWLFPTIILHTREPDRFMPLTEAMVDGLVALDGGPKISLKSGHGYLDYCTRTRALLTTHQISPHFADILLWYGQQQENDDSVPVEVAAHGATPVAPSEAVIRPSTAPTVEIAAPPHATSAAIGSPPARGASAPSKTSAAVAPRGSVGWLHLTDLHQGMHSSRWLWPNVLSSVFDDLGRLHDSCGPWDLVLFTGDLTQRGSAEEFKELDRTLERLWRRFEQLGSRPQLIAVPGNHDLKRPEHWYDPVPLALSQWHRHRELRDRVLDAADNPYIVELRRCFAAYTEWCARSPWFARENVREGLLPGDVAVSCSIGGLDVGVIGLNSTFLQLTGEDFFERLDIHPRQLQVCGDYASEWLQQHHINLLLTHHPPEWLEARARQEFRHEIDPGGRFAAHFYGHMHEGASTSTSHGGSHLRHTIQGASLFGLEEYDGPGGKVSRIHGYSAGRFEPLETTGPLEKVRVRVHPRRMIAGTGGRRIVPDHSQGELDARNSFSFEVQAAKRS